jgi:hypothetical protein
VVIALFVLCSGLAIFGDLGLKSEELNIWKVDHLPKDQGSGMSKAPEEPLLFGVFTSANDTESMRVLKHQYLSNDRNHYVIQSTKSRPAELWLHDALPTNRKMIIIPSLDNITYASKIGQNYSLDVIVYDIEKWENTPESERIAPLVSISKGARIVHEAGYRYGITPDAPTLIDNYKKINWTEIDFLNMQLQRFSQNITEYSSIANEISSFVRSENPNIEVFTQLSFRSANARDMIKIIEGVKDIVNGFIIVYVTRPDFCISSCSPHQLNLVLDRINSLKHNNNNHNNSISQLHNNFGYSPA